MSRKADIDMAYSVYERTTFVSDGLEVAYDLGRAAGLARAGRIARHNIMAVNTEFVVNDEAKRLRAKVRRTAEGSVK